MYRKGIHMYRLCIEYLSNVSRCIRNTDGMWDVLVFCIGRMWGNSDSRLNTLFTSILTTPNNRWFIGATDCPAADPGLALKDKSAALQRQILNPFPSPGNGGQLETSLSRLTRNLAR